MDWWLRRCRWERQMDRELRFHIESQIREYINQGMTPEQAERRHAANSEPSSWPRTRFGM